MPQQLAFPEFGAKAPAVNRLFFALHPDPDAAIRIERLTDELSARHRLRGKRVARERLHVTLHHLGDHEGRRQDIIADAHEAAKGISTAAFGVEFDRATSFTRGSGESPLVLHGGKGVAALMEFQRALGVAMAKSGLKNWVQSQFTPHVTMLYDYSSIIDQAVRPIGWTVREFILLHSLLGAHQHTVLGRWRLQD